MIIQYNDDEDEDEDDDDDCDDGIPSGKLTQLSKMDEHRPQKQLSFQLAVAISHSYVTVYQRVIMITTYSNWDVENVSYYPIIQKLDNWDVEN